jgi:hypothetical protein
MSFALQVAAVILVATADAALTPAIIRRLLVVGAKRPVRALLPIWG